MHWFFSANLSTTSTGRLVVADFFNLSLYEVQSELIICIFQDVILQKPCRTMLKILYMMQPTQCCSPPLPYLGGSDILVIVCSHFSVKQPKKYFFFVSLQSPSISVSLYHWWFSSNCCYSYIRNIQLFLWEIPVLLHSNENFISRPYECGLGLCAMVI